MKYLKITIAAVFGISLSASAQSWTELEVGLGAYSIQGEMQKQIVGFDNLNPVLTASIHTRPHKSSKFAFGGSMSAFTMQGDFSSDSKLWLQGHNFSGSGLNAQASMRYIMTGHKDMRFMKNAFLTYIEGAAGAHMISFQSTYPPGTSDNLNAPQESNEIIVTPIGTATLGFQYYFDYNFGVNLRLSGSVTGSDQLDGVEGITSTNDYIWAATVGMTYAF